MHRILGTFLLVFVFLGLSALPAFARGDVVQGPLTGEVLDVLDGDTFTVRVKVWINQNIETRVRIDGIDTPEIKGKCDAERVKAQAARTELQKLLRDKVILLSDIQYEKYAGRVLATVSTADGINIGNHMIGKGLARPYHGKKRAGWCDSKA